MFARLRFGSERLFLLFTQERLLLAHQAKVGREGVALASFLGRFAAGLRAGGKRIEALQQLTEYSPKTILSQNPGNFAIDYDDLVSVMVQRDDWDRARITVVTKNDKIELSASAVAARGLRDLVLSLLGDRAEFRI